MKPLKIIILAAILFRGSGLTYAQGGNRTLLPALHCLASAGQDWLGLQGNRTNALELGYTIDTNSDPGVRHFYLVAYSSGERSRGKIFDLVCRQNGRNISIDVQNNGSFMKSGKNILFTEPVLGGTWTQAHLGSAIKLVGRKPSITVRTVDLEASMVGVTCESYADK